MIRYDPTARVNRYCLLNGHLEPRDIFRFGFCCPRCGWFPVRLSDTARIQIMIGVYGEKRTRQDIDKKHGEGAFEQWARSAGFWGVSVGG